MASVQDGYAACLDPDPAIVRDAFDWLLLERRCCPFLHLELSFEPSKGPVWFRVRGGPGVKEFLAAAGLKASSVNSSSEGLPTTERRALSGRSDQRSRR